jgi:hypothetical protein
MKEYKEFWDEVVVCITSEYTYRAEIMRPKIHLLLCAYSLPSERVYWAVD